MRGDQTCGCHCHWDWGWLDFLEWCEVGSAIVQVERNYQWWVGDSWAFGEHAYSLFGRRERDGWTVWGNEVGAVSGRAS